jgi:peptidoglycan/xylan/chitin deacetylase (PgdA/CDA1 family)
MTFDDGPHAKNTPRLLDILARRNIKATFYVVGRVAKQYPHIMRRIAAEGHEIGNHSWSHPAFARMSKSSVVSQINRTQKIIRKTAGVTPTTLRPPYGSITSSQKKWIQNELGLDLVFWSLDPKDWKRPGSSVVSSRIVSRAKPGDIILAHDIHAPTITAMESALDGLLAKGLRFVTVSKLLSMEIPPEPNPTPAAPPVGATTAPSSSPPARIPSGSQ